MTGWIIAFIIIALIALLLSCSATVYVEYKDELKIHVGAFGFKFFELFEDEEEEELKIKKKAKKDKVKGESERGKEKSQTEDKTDDVVKTQKSDEEKGGQALAQKAKEKVKKSSGNDFADTVYLVLEFVKTSWPPLKGMLSKARITGLKMLVRVGQEDAAQTAITYAIYSAATYNAIAVLKSQITVKIVSINIVPDYTIQEINNDIRFKVKVRIYVIIGALVGIIINIIKNKEIMKRWGRK